MNLSLAESSPESTLCLQAAPLLAVPGAAAIGARGHQPERDVGGLEVPVRARGDVAEQAAAGGRFRQSDRLEPPGQAPGVDPGQESSGNGFDIPLHPADLPREQKARPRPGLERRAEQARRVDVGVPVDLAEPHELGAT